MLTTSSAQHVGISHGENRKLGPTTSEQSEGSWSRGEKEIQAIDDPNAKIDRLVTMLAASQSFIFYIIQ